MQLKEFKLNDIAHLEYGNKFDKNKMTHTNPKINLVSRTANNNGISDIVDEIDGILPYLGGSITLAFGGSVGSCFLQEEPFYTGQNVGVITFPDNISKETKLYVISSLEKKCKSSFHAFGNEINKHFKTDLSISLPVTKTGEIDWKYMEERIAELEQERIAELEQYLIASGLNDYTLTDEDKEILATKLTAGGASQSSTSGSGCWKEAREFDLSGLFWISTTKGIDKNKIELDDAATYEFVGRTTTNYGVQGHTKLLSYGPNPANSFSLIQVGESVALWREKEWYASQNLFLLSPKHSEIKYSYLYLQTAINKAMAKYGVSYNSYPTIKSLNNTSIVLPIRTNPDGTPIINPSYTYHPDGYIPDGDYMERYIKAIEKVVIKDVVKYKDEIIVRTKEVVDE